MGIKKTAAYGSGMTAALASGLLLTYPWLLLAQAVVFTWMFCWGHHFGYREEKARLESLYEKKH